jgi:hypothetical protein
MDPFCTFIFLVQMQSLKAKTNHKQSWHNKPKSKKRRDKEVLADFSFKFFVLPFWIDVAYMFVNSCYLILI